MRLFAFIENFLYICIMDASLIEHISKCYAIDFYDEKDKKRVLKEIGFKVSKEFLKEKLFLVNEERLTIFKQMDVSPNRVKLYIR